VRRMPAAAASSAADAEGAHQIQLL